MLRQVLILAILSSALAVRLEVTVFRGLVPMQVCYYDTDQVNTVSVGIRLYDCAFTPEAKQFVESLEKLTLKVESENVTIIPYRFLEKLTYRSTHFLGVVIQTTYRCAETGDEFQLSLVFGYCKNELDISVINKIHINEEENRSHQIAKVQDTVKSTKQEGGKKVANEKSLEKLEDELLDSSTEKAKLEAENEDLTKKMSELEKRIEEGEVGSANLEEAHENCSVQLKTIKGKMCTVTAEIDSLERQIATVERRLTYQEETDFSEEYVKALEDLNQSFESSKAYNKKMLLPFAVKGIPYDHKALEVLY